MTEKTVESFEKLYRELEDTVRQLESGELSLEQSMALFEKGVSLAGRCNTMLDTAELRVQQISENASGKLQGEPMGDRSNE